MFADAARVACLVSAARVCGHGWLRLSHRGFCRQHIIRHTPDDEFPRAPVAEPLNSFLELLWLKPAVGSPHDKHSLYAMHCLGPLDSSLDPSLVPTSGDYACAPTTVMQVVVVDHVLLRSL